MNKKDQERLKNAVLFKAPITDEELENVIMSPLGIVLIIVVGILGLIYLFS
jgi:hypothetical protein